MKYFCFNFLRANLNKVQCVINLFIYVKILELFEISKRQDASFHKKKLKQ